MFRFSSALGRHWIVLCIVLCIVLMSAAAAWLNAGNTDRSIREQLENRSASIAALLDKEAISELTGTDADMQNPRYLQTKQTLAGLKELNPDVRSIYVTVERAGKLYFYVDSEQPGSAYYSPPGEYYPDATPLFKSLYRTGDNAVEGPTKDEFGTWVSGLAPIRDPATGSVIAVIGMDIDAAYYYRSVAQAAAIPLLLGVVALAVVTTNEVIRRRQERLLKLQSELVSIASHELRSPLAGVRWATESLIPHLDNANQVMAQRILVSATKLQNSIDDILQVSRVTNLNRHTKLQMADHDLTKLVKEICDTQQLAAEQRGITVTMDGSWGKSITVHCDAERLKRAIQNVISNAVKYTRDNTEVFVNYHYNGDHHMVRVTDQGIGVPEAEKKKIFDGFYRASNAAASKVQGTGLGLYLTRIILEQHGGTVTVDSKQDVGTTISLLLPG